MSKSINAIFIARGLIVNCAFTLHGTVNKFLVKAHSSPVVSLEAVWIISGEQQTWHTNKNVRNSWFTLFSLKFILMIKNHQFFRVQRKIKHPNLLNSLQPITPLINHESWFSHSHQISPVSPPAKKTSKHAEELQKGARGKLQARDACGPLAVGKKTSQHRRGPGRSCDSR